MLKPLILVRGLNVLPLLSHTRNILFIHWSDMMEYKIPMYGEKPKGKPEIEVKDNEIIITFKEELN